MKSLRIILLSLVCFIGLITGAIAAELRGQVLYNDGRPVPNVEVAIDGKKTKTDGSGIFSIDLKPGKYTIQALCRDHEPAREIG
jgi:uncharacterized GH25 family protein